MKTRSRIALGCLGLTVACAARTAWAGPHPAAVNRLAATVVVAQAADGESADEQRARALDLLGRARQALKEKDFETAETLISRAEAVGAEFGVFHLGDSPKKARRDLERARAAAARAAERPSQRFLPRLGDAEEQAAPASGDPFAAQAAAEAADTPPAQPAPLPTLSDRPAAEAQLSDRPAPPPTEDPAPLPSSGRPASADLRFAAGTPQARAESDELLLAARRALSYGDTRRASEYLEQAAALGLSYQPAEDSPHRVAQLADRVARMAAVPANQSDTAATRRQRALLLMEQAEGLMQWQDWDSAERLLDDAAALRVPFNQFESRPEVLLQRVAQARRQGVESLPTVGADASAPRAAPAGQVDQATAELRKQTLELCAQARAALKQGDIQTAEALALRAESLGVSDAAFGPQDDRPWLLLLQVQRMREGVVQTGGAEPIDAAAAEDGYAGEQAVYDSDNDPTRTVPAAAFQQPLPTELGGQLQPEQGSAIPALTDENGVPLSVGMQLFVRGEDALRARERDAALELFRQAYARREELDPGTQQRLQDHLQFLSAAPERVATPEGSLIDDAASQQQLMFRQVSAEVSKLEQQARAAMERSPQQALDLLAAARSTVEGSALDDATRNLLLRRVDRTAADVQQYLTDNSARLELETSNRQTQEEIERTEQVRVEVQGKIAELVDEFNQLMDEQRYAEAEVVARRAQELAPEESVVLQLIEQSRFVRRMAMQSQIRDDKERAVVDALTAVDASAVPFGDDTDPYRFGDAQEWERLTASRGAMFREGRSRRSEAELQIEQQLKTPVSLNFENVPLAEVLDYLAKVSGVPVHLDPQGLAEEGVTSDTPVTIDLSQEISLKSALSLILQPLHLSYVIEDEVLKITSESGRKGAYYEITYLVSDLVIPIPNFVPSGNMGMAGAVNDAYARHGFAGSGFANSSAMPVMASASGAPGNAALDPKLMAQMAAGGMRGGMPGMVPIGGGGSPSSGVQQPIGFGPGGMGGGVQADFDSLIELITTTVQPDSWDSNGGEGAIAPFETNLSLVISQTQEVHEQIADLLEQLRRLQDLQVTIEVRFITLNDNFFERIGVDFDFDVDDDIDGPFQVFGRPDPAFEPNFGGDDDDNAGINPGRDVQDRDHGQSVTVGMSAPGVFSADLDVPFRQGSFGLATPQFGGFDANAGANIGFSILSDIEAFFFIEAAQGDRRSNVLQAPKVTMFNGQQAIVSDTSQSPFVISVIPVVGDFAAAQQPVIVVLNEGTFLSVQAVISSDRRFVRLTVVPFFSNIGEVNTFTFEGTETTTENSSSEGPSDATTGRTNNRTRVRSGTTVQLPTFSFVTVSTTVSVPDGGTVLLGGIKRLSEGRNEFGVPLLNKIPYVNRLFSNVGIGRETQSLMMMVTPRIIIQEEEEALLGIQSTP